jgi:hypothetical protein
VLCFGSADSKGVMGESCVSADSEGVREEGAQIVKSRPFEAPFAIQGKKGKHTG